MVRAIPNNPWHATDFLERIRPGFALSIALHAGLLVALAYILAFRPAIQMPPVDKTEVLTLIDVPSPPKAKPQQTPKLHLDVAPKIFDIQSDVAPLKVPPELTFDGPPAETKGEIAPPADIIVNPKPIYRGGLVYPERAADAGVPGYVDFNFIIEPDGSVGDPLVTAEVPDGYGFAAAAKKAFPKWRFEPRLVNGKPVAWPASIRISFKLQ